MSNPSVTAVIGVDDKASPRLRELMELSQKLNRVAKDLNNQGGDRYANGLRHATTAAREHLSVMERVHKVQHAVMGTVAGVATFKALQIAKHAIVDYLPLERESRYQKAVGHYSAADMALLERQRVHAAAVYGLRAEDTIHAQMAFTTRAFNAQVTEAGTKQAIILSKALNVQAEKAAQLVEAITFAQGKHPNTAEEATREIGRSSDVAAYAAKRSGMSAEDIQQAAKYGTGPATASGISLEQQFASYMAFKRSQVSGDEAGTWLRQLAARTLAPTQKGRAALALAGIRYEDFATQGDISADAISAELQRNYGKGLGDAAKREYEKRVAENPDIVGSREKLVSAVVESMTKAGGEELSRTDEKHVTKTIGRLYDVARTGMRGGALFERIIKDFTQSQMLAFLGDKQGGRGALLLNNRDQYFKYREGLEAESQGYALTVANERLEGLAAATDRLMASFDMASKQMVKANEGWLTPAAEVAAKAAGLVASRFSSSRVALSASAGLGALAGLSAAGATVASLVASFGGLTVNANLAATSLARIAAGGAVGTAAGAAGGAVTAGAAGLTASRVAAGLAIASRFAGWAGVAVLGYQAMNAVSGAEPNPEADSNYAKWRWNNALHADERRSRQNAMSSFISGYTSMPVPPSEQRLSTLKALGLSDDQVTDNSNPALASGRVNVKGGGSFGDVNVSGTVTGSAEMFQHFTLEVKPNTYFESLVQRAEQASRVTLNGQLGTGGHGPGDNSVKPAAPTGVQ